MKLWCCTYTHIDQRTSRLWMLSNFAISNFVHTRAIQLPGIYVISLPVDTPDITVRINTIPSQLHGREKQLELKLSNVKRLETTIFCLQGTNFWHSIIKAYYRIIAHPILIKNWQSCTVYVKVSGLRHLLRTWNYSVFQQHLRKTAIVKVPD